MYVDSVMEVILWTLCCLVYRDQPWGPEETGAVIITPARELATQISAVFCSFLPAELSVRLLIGGKDVGEDVAAINRKG